MLGRPAGPAGLPLLPAAQGRVPSLQFPPLVVWMLGTGWAVFASKGMESGIAVLRLLCSGGPIQGHSGGESPPARSAAGALSMPRPGLRMRPTQPALSLSNSPFLSPSLKGYLSLIAPLLIGWIAFVPVLSRHHHITLPSKRFLASAAAAALGLPDHAFFPATCSLPSTCSSSSWLL